MKSRLNEARPPSVSRSRHAKISAELHNSALPTVLGRCSKKTSIATKTIDEA